MVDHLSDAQRAQPLLQTRVPNGKWPHVHAAPAGAKIHGYADDVHPVGSFD